MPHAPAVAVLGGGCFWCLEAVFRQLQGVREVVSGYAGGEQPNPSYQDVCSGRTGHAEVVRVAYDPAVLSFRDLLEVFFAIHDPTTRNRQGADVGPQYRSVIFYGDEAQRAQASEMIAELTRARVFGAPIVTELCPAEAFYEAEGYHQGYYGSHSEQPYCQLVIAPKLAKLRREFAARLRTG
jgi:peptide-methionine (S)-S-oxide reductase